MENEMSSEMFECEKEINAGSVRIIWFYACYVRIIHSLESYIIFSINNCSRAVDKQQNIKQT